MADTLSAISLKTSFLARWRYRVGVGLNWRRSRRQQCESLPLPR